MRKSVAVIAVVTLAVTLAAAPTLEAKPRQTTTATSAKQSREPDESLITAIKRVVRKYFTIGVLEDGEPIRPTIPIP